MKKLIYITIGCMLIFMIGFFTGRCSQEKEIKYVKEKPIHGSASPPKPIYEKTPTVPSLPIKYVFYTDTVYQEVDTAKIIHEYSQEKRYDFTLFDDLYGKLQLKPTLQYNSLQRVDYTFTPITKEIIKKDIFDIFTTIGYATNETALIGGGFFYKRIGVEYNYNIRLIRYDHLDNNYHTFKLHYKF